MLIANNTFVTYFDRSIQSEEANERACRHMGQKAGMEVQGCQQGAKREKPSGLCLKAVLYAPSCYQCIAENKTRQNLKKNLNFIAVLAKCL